MVGHLQNIFMELLWHKRKLDNFDPCNVWVIKAIATNILVLLKTGFVIQGYILNSQNYEI